MNYAIILAGGIGSRFWPLSRESKPKQFLEICSGKPMIEETICRISSLIDKNRIYVATNKKYSRKLNTHLKPLGIKENNILLEPVGKNTFIPISLLSKLIFNKDSEAIIIVTPSDHFIKNKNRFLRNLKIGIKAAELGHIVTLGVIPHRAETGYGYIKVKNAFFVKGNKVYRADNFIEKPSLNIAKKLIQNKKYYWNSGTFIFKAEVLLDEIKRLHPNIYKAIEKISIKDDIYKCWLNFPSISIDYAIMEKTKKLILVPETSGWIELGSWRAVEEVSKKDKFGNISKGRHIDLGSKNIIVWAEKGNKIVATLGLKNIIVVDTKGALLVCAKDKTQDVKQIIKKVELLQEKV